MQRNHLAEQLHLLSQQPLLVGFSPVLPLSAKRGEFRIEFKGQRMHPDEIRPALQIENISFREALRRPGRGVNRQPALLVKFVVASVGANIVVRMDHEEVVEQIDHVVGRQPIRRQPRDAKMSVFVRVFRILPKLHEQARHKIQRGLELGHLAKQLGHAPIVARGMEPHPRHRVLARDVVRVIRLMLMPEKSKPNFVHRSFLSLNPQDVAEFVRIQESTRHPCQTTQSALPEILADSRPRFKVPFDMPPCVVPLAELVESV